MSSANHGNLTPVEFLIWEAQQPDKHEYRAGQIWDKVTFALEQPRFPVYPE